MVDREVRAAEREGIAASLRQRVRAGDLPRERLWLAALLSFEPAVEALGERPGLEPAEASLESFGAWLAAIGGAGPEAVVRAALVAADGAAHHFDLLFRGTREDSLPRGGLEAAQIFLASPSAPARQVIARWTSEAQRVLGGLTHAGRLGDPNPPHTSALEAAIFAVSAAVAEDPVESASRALWCAAGADAVGGSIPPHAVEDLCDRVGEELIGWALGEG